MPRTETAPESFFRTYRSTVAMENPVLAQVKLVVSSGKRYPQQIVGLGKALTLRLGENKFSSVQEGNDPDSAFRQAVVRGFNHFQSKK